MIYLCIPAHNEEQTVGVVLWKIRQVMAELQRDYQLLVADDASTDRTQDVLEPYTRVLPLTVARNAERRGYAVCLEMLVREAAARSDYPKRDVIITLQADFTDEPGHVDTLVRRIESGADIVATNMLPLRNAPRLVRWRRPGLNALLRRLGWPQDVRDPLNGFNAYRAICIQRAIEEHEEARLLRHEGWAANAQLLHQAAQHARRVDVVDLQPHPERLQRTSRFQFMPALKEVMALRRGRAADDLLPVSELRPASVMGGPSSQRRLLAESLRNGADERPQARRSRNGGQRAEAGGEPRRAGGRPRKTAQAETRPPRPTKAKDAEARTERARPARPRRDAVATPATDPATDPPKKRSRRGRRGGTGRARNGQTAGPTAQPLEGDVAVQPAVPETVVNGDAEAAPMVAAEAGSESGPAKRRRPNRRGGRGRRRRSEGETEASDVSPSAAEPPSEPAPAENAS